MVAARNAAVWMAGCQACTSMMVPVCLVVFACVQPAGAQVSGHQRLGVQSTMDWEADIEVAVSLRPPGYPDLPDLDASLSLGLILDRKLNIGFSFPFRLSGWSGGEYTWILLPGDISASLGWTANLGDDRVRGALNLTGPSALWQGNQEVPGSVAGGSGRWTAGLSGGISRIIDPLVLSGFLAWSVGFPRAQRWGRTWRPGDFLLVLSVTEAFNEHVSCTLGLSQYASLEEREWESSSGSAWGGLLQGSVSYDVLAGIEFKLSWSSFTVGIGLSKGLIPGADPGSVSFSVCHSLRHREES